MEKVLSGKPVSALINKASKRLILAHNIAPRMLLIQVGEDPASSYYVQSIISSGTKLGCICDLLSLPESITEQELLSTLETANADPAIHGIMIQKPLPKQISDTSINLAINPLKDLDSLHPANLGRIMMEADGFLPCTPAAVFYTLRYYEVDPIGKNLVILGRSNVVGKPLANMLLWKRAFANATVTVCHSRTPNLPSVTCNADILISAIGKANFVNAEMIKAGCILIDVGINESSDPEGKTIYVGDIDYNSVYSKAMAVTPVPGGVGRITTSVLYLNLVKACLDSMGVNKSVDEYITLIFDAN